MSGLYRYSTDLGKFVGAPILHANGDHPEDVIRATRLALEYRRKFRKDVFVELHCFRRWGHNELDDPTFTNPKLYSQIHSRRFVCIQGLGLGRAISGSRCLIALLNGAGNSKGSG